MRLLIFCITSGVLLYILLVLQHHPEHKPNIILLVIDTLRADKLGAYGQTQSVSPEIDAIAHRGIVFEQAISQASWTRSSMASMLTSKYPTKINVVKEQWDTLPTSQATLAELLQAHGYLTIGITANPQLNKKFGFSQGFDRYFESQALFDWMKPQGDQFIMDGKRRASTAEDVFARALEELKRPRNTPVYLQLQLMDVHEYPLIDPAAIALELRANALIENRYLQSIKTLSTKIGRFIDTLEKDTAYDLANTLLIITADHGEGLLDHMHVYDSTWHGQLLYRSELWVPLIFYGWGKAKLPERRIKGLTELLDIFPTVLDLSQIDIPPELDGRSLKEAIIRNQSLPDKRVAFSHTAWRPGVNKAAAISEKWIYLHNNDTWPGTSDVELQEFWGSQNGALTNQLHSHSAEAVQLEAELTHWEESAGKLDSSVASEPPNLSASELLQLKSLGYLSGGRDNP